jgi:hypothetical protein
MTVCRRILSNFCEYRAYIVSFLLFLEIKKNQLKNDMPNTNFNGQLTWCIKQTAITIPQRQVGQTFHLTISLCVNFEEFQLALTRKIALSSERNQQQISLIYLQKLDLKYLHKWIIITQTFGCLRNHWFYEVCSAFIEGDLEKASRVWDFCRMMNGDFQILRICVTNTIKVLQYVVRAFHVNVETVILSYIKDSIRVIIDLSGSIAFVHAPILWFDSKCIELILTEKRRIDSIISEYYLCLKWIKSFANSFLGESVRKVSDSFDISQKVWDVKCPVKKLLKSSIVQILTLILPISLNIFRICCVIYELTNIIIANHRSSF